jgi:hypothetical protein
MTSRLFTFGCSFTNYHWPTWADIMSQEYDEFQNWAQIGCGNHFIFYSLIECIRRNQISDKDTIGIMWTGITREDRYVDKQWKPLGSVFLEETPYPREYIENFTDPTGYLITNLAVVESCRQILDSIGCRYYFLSMVPLQSFVETKRINFFNLLPNLEQDVIDLYSCLKPVLLPSMLEVVYKNDFSSRDHVPVPHRKHHKRIDSLRERYNQVAGADWPTFDVFYNCQDNSNICMKEISDMGLVEWRKVLREQRGDNHPTPNEHLEYLEQLNITVITDQQREYAQKWTNQLLSHEPFEFSTQLPKRF